MKFSSQFKPKFSYLSVIFSPALLLCPIGAQAQTSLQDVVITANRLPTKISDVIADVTVIDRETLDLAGSSSLVDILSQQPGVQISRNGSYRSSSGVFLRGASSSQTIVLVDGVRVGSATSGAASLENIPLERIERIEILRGAASALYGPDAVGGVIQIFTRSATARPTYSAHVGAGNVGQVQAGAAVRGTQGELAYSLGVSTERGDGISVVNNPAASSYNADRDGFKARSVDAKLVWSVNSAHQLSTTVLKSQTDYQFDGSAYPNPLKLTKATTDAWANADLLNASLQWKAQWTPQWTSTVQWANSEDKSLTTYYRTTDHAFGGNGRFNTQRQQASWQNDVRFGKDVLSFAAEHKQEEVDSSTKYSVTTRDLNSAMLSYALYAGDWHGLAVLRNDHDSQFGSFSNWALSGAYQLSSGLRAVASTGSSFQAPTFNQLYYPGYGNPALTPQRNHSQEVGLKFHRGALHLESVVYQNDVQGFINSSNNQQSALAVLRGVSVSAAWRQGATSYSASYDYADPRTRPNNLRLVRVARQLANARVQHQWQDMLMWAELKVSGEREDNNLTFNGRTTLGAYSVLNLGTSWQLNGQTSLALRVNNVGNKKYALANTYSMPQRHFLLALNFKG